MTHVLGIDVSKAKLDVALRRPDGKLRSCSIPDHHIVPSRSPLLLAREVFRELAGDGDVTDREVFAC